MQQHLRRSTQAQSEPRRQTWTQRAKALCLAGLMALASTPLWAQTNQPPILGLTQPWEGANFNAPANVTLAAWAYDADGIQSIAFYDGATLLATDTQAPYEFQWANVPAGSHSITARATDTRGSVATSAAMSFTVNGSGPNDPPILGLTQPWEGANFNAPANVTLGAWAYDPDGIQSIAFYDGATLLTTDTQAPYEFLWTNVPAGSHSITARATDTRGSVATSAAMSFTVNGNASNQAPTVNLTSPATGASFTAPATVTITANATDSDGSIASVAFYNGATLLGTDASAPYSFSWSNVAAGSYSVTARATDNQGAMTTSAAVAVTVNAPANVAPTVSLTAPAAGASFTAPATVSITADAADSDGSIVSVAFYNGATLLGTDTTAPYSFTWTNVAAGSYSLTARATDDDGATTTSAVVNVTLSAANQSPTVALTGPVSGARFTAPATVNITANATDSDGSIASVAFYNGATLLGTDTSAPYSFSWSNIAAGSYSVTVRATDNQGAVTTSTAVAVTVNAPANQAPTVNLTAPAAGASFTAPATVDITVDAADSDGSIASVSFYNGTTLLGIDTSAPYSFSWSNVAAGSYSVTAQATDNSGATSTSAAVAVTVNAPANTAPIVSLTSPATGVQFTAPATVNITADAADTDGAVASVAFYSGATLLSTDTTAPYSFSWANVPAGTYSLTSRATDDDGATTISAAVSLTVSAANQTPTVALTGPTAGTEFTAPASIMLTADAADTDGIISGVAFYNGATLLGTDTSAPYSYSWANVAAGSYSITARATDNQGAVTTSAAVAVTVNAPANVAPTASLTAPAAGAQFTAPASITLTADAADTDGSIASVAFYNGATLLGTDTSAPYSFSWSNVAAGSYSVTAQATDNSGAVTTSTAVSVTVNAPANQAPAVSLTSPAAGANFTAPATVNITADAADSDGSISSVAFYNGATLLGTDTTAPYSFSWANVPAGTYSLTARATDDDSATTTSAAVSVTVSAANQTPTVALTSPAAGTEFTAPASITLTADATDSDGSVASVAFYNGATLLGTDTSAPYSYSWTNVAAGSYSVTARATDNQGAMTTSAAVAVTVNAPANAAPTVSLTAPAPGTSFTAPATVNITANATDSDGSIASVAFYNGATLLGTDTSAPYSYSWSNVAAGSYSITARATDNQGAVTTSAAVAVTVNALANAAPTVSLTAPAAGASFTAPATVNITADAADSDGSIVSVAFYNGATLLGTDTTAPYSFSWADAPAGTYSLTARATDDDGASTTSAAVSVTVSLPQTSPSVSITAPANGAEFQTPTSVTITVAASGGAGDVSRVEFRHYNMLLHTDTTAPFTYTLQPSSEQRLQIHARVFNSLGQTADSESISLSFVNPAPVVQLTSPSFGTNYSAPATVTLNVEASDSNGTISRVDFYRNFSILLGSDTTAPYSFTWVDVPEGSYPLTAMAIDDGGAIGHSNGSYVTVVNTPETPLPTVRITSPSDSESFSAPATLNLSAEANAPEGRTIRRVLYYINGVLARSAESPPFIGTWSGDSGAGVASGTYQITAQAIDNTGAEGPQSAPITVVVTPDQRPPTVSITSPGVASSFLAPGTITLRASGWANPERTITSVDFYQGSTHLGTANVAPYSFQWANVAAGSYTITARITDSAGAVASSTARLVEVVGSDQAPTVNIIEPAPGSSYTAPATIRMNARAEAGSLHRTIRSVAIYRDGTLLNSTSGSSNVRSWTDVPVGNYTLTAVVTDDLGATATSAPVAVSVVAEAVPVRFDSIRPTENEILTSNSTHEVLAYPVDPQGLIRRVRFELTHNGQVHVHEQSWQASTQTVASMPSSYLRSPGQYSVVIGAFNEAGEEIARSPARSFSRSSAPALSVSAPENNLELAAPAAVNVAGTAQLPTGVAGFPLLDRVEIYLGQTLVSANARVSGTSEFAFTLTDVPEGNHEIRIRAISTDGAAAEQVRFVRVLAPSDPGRLYISYPTEGAQLQQSGNFVTVGGLLAQWNDLASARMEGVGPSSSFSGAFSRGDNYRALGALLAGNWRVRAIATTNQGATRVTEWVNFTVYRRSIEILGAHSYGQVPSPGNMVMEASAEDCVGCIAAVEFRNGEAVLATVGAPPYQFNVSSLPVGSYSITARMVPVDAARGVMTSAPVAVTVVPNAVPTVVITSPAQGATLVPNSTVTIAAEAADSNGSIRRVAFYNGATLLGTDTSAPYSYSWTSVPAGIYSLTAVATDDGGAVTTSAVVTVNVAVPNQAPTVSLTSPAAGASFTAPASITLTADAADADGSLASVAFYNGATLLGTDTTAPYSFNWADVPAGSYSITAVATDNGGATTTSAAVAVTVEEDTGETITYIHTDVSGSPLAATNEAGNVVWKENYRAYGERQLEQPGSEGQGQWFHGKEADAATGLQYFGARYYDPAVGRFMGVDPVGFQEDSLHSFNRYAYGNNNPVRYLDPDGMQAYEQQTLMLVDSQGMIGPRTVNMVPGFKPPMGSAELAANVLGMASGAPALRPLIGIGAGLLKGGIAAAKGATSLSPASIRFSQSSVNGVEEIAASMRASGWKGDPIDVVRMSDGSLTTFDNTRLLAAQRAGINVQAVVHDAGAAFPAGRWTPRSGVQPATWEDAIRARIQQQNSGFRNTYPSGSPYTGSTQ